MKKCHIKIEDPIEYLKCLLKTYDDTIVFLDRTFKGCAKLTGTLNANKLWNNKNILWCNTGSTFAGCSDEIRAQVPVSWGGTASDDIIEKSLEEKYNDLLARVEALESK